MKKIIYGLALICLFIGSASAREVVNYDYPAVAATYNYTWQGANATRLYAGEDYRFEINVTGFNLTSIYVGDARFGVGDDCDNFASSTISVAQMGIGYCYEGGSVDISGDVYSNCTYATALVNITNFNVTTNTYSSNTSTAEVMLNITLPCLEHSSIAASMTASDKDTASLTLADFTLSNSIVWLAPQPFNTTNSTCIYDCVNAELCVNRPYYLSGCSSASGCNTTSRGPCILEVNRTTSQSGVVAIDVDESWNPGNLPAALGAGMVGLIIVGGVRRVKRRGSVTKP